MTIKWNKTAIKNLLSVIEFIETNGFHKYAEQLETDILRVIRELPQNHSQYAIDRFRTANDGTFRAFIIDNYRVSFRVKPNEIQILRIRHTKRKPVFYKK